MEVLVGGTRSTYNATATTEDDLANNEWFVTTSNTGTYTVTGPTAATETPDGAQNVGNARFVFARPTTGFVPGVFTAIVTFKNFNGVVNSVQRAITVSEIGAGEDAFTALLSSDNLVVPADESNLVSDALFNGLGLSVTMILFKVILLLVGA